MLLNNFNFANPWWLLGLSIIPIGYILHRFASRQSSTDALRNFIDPKLLPHVLISEHKITRFNWGWIYAGIVACIIIALANPRWGFAEVEAYQPTASMVILFDLSDPAAVAAGRQRIEDLIDESKGVKLGLIAFAGMAHMITPITDDLQTLKTYLPALDSDLITKQGDNLRSALQMADQLLSSEPGDNKSILLVSSGAFTDRNYMKDLKHLVDKKIGIYAIGVGDMNTSVLQSIAKAGQGTFVKGTNAQQAVQPILSKVQAKREANHQVAGKVRQWNDQYHWLLVVAVVLFLYVFKHRALFLLPLFIACPDAQALDVFRNVNQQAQYEFRQGNFDRASALFTDNYNKAVALYRAEKYAAAEQLFQQVDSTVGKYNAGNAQMQQKKWRAAINSYESVLAQSPDDKDAQFNLELAKSMLENDDQDQENDDQDDEKQDKQEDKNKQPDKDKQQDQEKNKDKEKNQDKEKQPNEDSNSNGQNPSDESSKENKQDKPAPAQPKSEAGADESQGQDSNGQDQAVDLQTAQDDEWLNRIDSDIKILLRNKFYIEGVLSDQQDM